MHTDINRTIDDWDSIARPCAIHERRIPNDFLGTGLFITMEWFGSVAVADPEL